MSSRPTQWISLMLCLLALSFGAFVYGDLPEQVATHFNLAGEADELRVADDGEHPADPSVVFLAPLDPLVWDRDLLRSLFDFDYVWEVYVPQAKRRWGYYVLPLLWGDRLAGRIEPRIDRQAKAVRILGLWWEDGFRPRREAGFTAAMRCVAEAAPEAGA